MISLNYQVISNQSLPLPTIEISLHDNWGECNHCIFPDGDLTPATKGTACAEHMFIDHTWYPCTRVSTDIFRCGTSKSYWNSNCTFVAVRYGNHAADHRHITVGATQHRYHLSIVVLFRCFQNDPAHQNYDRYRQFIEYYRLLGVEHFYIYDNVNTADESLYTHFNRYYIPYGIVTYEPWYAITLQFGYPTSQSSAYNHFTHKYGQETTYVLQVDFDEFLFLPNHHEINSLHTLINQYALQLNSSIYVGLSFTCWFFGSQLMNRSNSNLMLIDQYQYRRLQPEPISTRTKPYIYATYSIYGSTWNWIKLLLTIDTTEAFLAHYWMDQVNMLMKNFILILVIYGIMHYGHLYMILLNLKVLI